MRTVQASASQVRTPLKRCDEGTLAIGPNRFTDVMVRTSLLFLQ